MSDDPAVPREIPDPRLRGWGPWVVALVLVLGPGVGLRLSALQVGFLGDDYAHRAMVEGRFGAARGALDLFSWFVDAPAELEARRALGAMPWWSEAGLSVRVLRPLTSLGVWLDQSLFPGQALPQHLHSMAWWVALLVLFMLFAWRRLGPMPALLGGLVLACDPAATTPVGWVANRAALICAVFGLLALHLEVRAGEAEPDPTGWTPPRWPAWLCTGLALLGGEYGLAILGPLLVRAVVVERDWMDRLRVGAPHLGLGLAYLTLHRALGYGTTAGQLYTDPFTRPGTWLGEAALRIPAMAGQLVLSVMAALRHLELRLMSEWGEATARAWLAEGVEGAAQRQLAYGVVALVVAPLLYLLARRGLRAAEQQAATWLGLGALLALVPLSAAPPHGRLLLIPGIAYAAHLGLVLTGLGRLALGHETPEPPHVPPGWPVRSLAGFVGVALLGLHVGADARWNAVELEDIRARAERDVRVYTNDRLASTDLEGEDVIVVAAPGFDMVVFGAFYAHDLRGQTPRSWQSLSLLEGPVVLQRPGKRSIRVFPLAADQAWLRAPMERFFRPVDAPVEAGDVLTQAELEVEVLSVDDEGRPTGLEVRFPRRLESYTWLVSDVQGLREIQMPRIKGALPIAAPALPHPRPAS